MSILGAFILPHPPIILPEIGHGEEKKIALTIQSYQECAKLIAKLNPDTIILTSPHSTIYSDYFHISPNQYAKGDLAQFGASEIKVEAEYDVEFVSLLEKIVEKEGVSAGTLGEKDSSLDHGTIIPLTFINKLFEKPYLYKLVRIGISYLPVTDHYKLGMCIACCARQLNRKVVFIASGDLSHKVSSQGPYGYAKEGVEFDKQITKAMEEADFLKFLTFSPDFSEKAAECGLRSFLIMAGALDKIEVNAKLYSYEGTFGVGYGVASFLPKKDENNFVIRAEEGFDTRAFLEQYEAIEKKRRIEIRESEDEYVRLARYSLEYYVKTRKKATFPLDLSEELKNHKAGIFVSLKKYGILRGCIGTIFPTTHSIAEEIINNAISAGTKDSRFEPVTVTELDELVYSVDVLSPTEAVDSMEQLDVERYGVIVTSGYKRGLLLPNLEGVDTVEKQIEIAMDKAGILKGEPIILERFEVIRHK